MQLISKKCIGKLLSFLKIRAESLKEIWMSISFKTFLKSGKYPTKLNYSLIYNLALLVDI